MQKKPTLEFLYLDHFLFITKTKTTKLPYFAAIKSMWLMLKLDFVHSSGAASLSIWGAAER